MRCIPRLEQIREDQPRPRRWKYGIRGCGGGRAVIWMIHIIVSIVGGLHVTRHHSVGFVLPYDARQLPAQSNSWLKLTIRIAQEDRLCDSEEVVSGRLLLFA